SRGVSMEVYRSTDRGYEADEQLARLFTPHAVLPSQFFSSSAWRARLQGEQRLMLAVLEDAVHVYCKESATPGRRNSSLVREAEEWIESVDGTWVFSFACICGVLELDAEYIRRGLRAWRGRPSPERVARATKHATELRRASGE